MTPGPAFVFGEPRTLFAARRYRSLDYRREYSVAPDDQRFVFHRRLNAPESDRIVVIENVTRSGTGARQ